MEHFHLKSLSQQSGLLIKVFYHPSCKSLFSILFDVLALAHILRPHAPIVSIHTLTCQRKGQQRNLIVGGQDKVTLSRWLSGEETTIHCSFVLITEGVSVFGAFLRSEFSEENLQFYLACGQYQQSSNNFSLQRRAKDICTTYIQPGSPREVQASPPRHAASSCSVLFSLQDLVTGVQLVGQERILDLEKLLKSMPSLPPGTEPGVCKCSHTLFCFNKKVTVTHLCVELFHYSTGFRLTFKLFWL